MNHTEIENKWKKYWAEHDTFKTDMHDFSKPKFYALDMFPYPSGAGLHVGHPEGYTATDIVCRMKRMQGYNVLHPMGFDSFGLPAEQYAIETGNNPSIFTEKNTKYFRSQLQNLGFSYDWGKEISTSDPRFYKWTQWIFKLLYNDGLAKCIDYPVNWCEELGCVLANDEIVDGKSERGGYPVVKRNMRQWVIDIPKYAERLLKGLDEIDWPESTKAIQRNWIGKSEGVEVDFEIEGGGKFSIFTTCIETIFGITFMVLAPEHRLVDKLKNKIKNWAEVEAYRKDAAAKSDLERTELNKGKSGVRLDGVYAINPVNNKRVPIFLGDFVLASYGDGAVMAVPSHDQRDFEYAKAHNISEFIQVIDGRDCTERAFEKQDYLGKGCKLINSAEFSGLTVEEAKKAITAKLVKEGKARKTVNYHLREWVFARQRYWGEPIPIVHFEDGTTAALDDKDLPLLLPPLDDYKPSKDGKSPLAKNEKWVNVNFKGRAAKRETSTMPGSAGSSWYFLRYIDPHNDKKFADFELLKHWMPVDLYVGGPEHAVGHLLYSRMWNNYLFDKGLVPVKEPFKKLVHPGMILGANGIKMGKRYPQFVVDPNDIVKKYGADTLRLYEMFMGPLEISKPWDDNGVAAARKFLDRIYRLYHEKKIGGENKNLQKIYHQTVKKVTEDYENLAFNTAISQMMIFVNALSKEDVFPREYAEGFVKLLNPICPFITEEMWQELGHSGTIAYEKWPSFDENKMQESTAEIAVQVNSKIISRVVVDLGLSQEQLVQFVMGDEKVTSAIDGKQVVKSIVVPGRIVNLIVK